MRFRIDQRFTHGVDAVQAALVDPAFLTRMAELPKLGRPELVAREDSGPKVTMRVRYAFVGDLSSAVRRVVDPARLTWVEESISDRSTHRATFTILPDNYPGMLACAGTFTLSPAGAGSVRVAVGDLRVRVPLVGAKVERAILSGLEEHAAAEAALVEAWLDQGLDQPD